MSPINILTISFLLLLGLFSPASGAKETVSLNANISKLNQIMASYEKQVSRLASELTNALNRYQKIAEPNDIQSQTLADLEKANGWVSQINDSINTTKNYGHILENSEKIIATVKKDLENNIEYIQLERIQSLSLDELNNAYNQVVVDLETERNRRTDLELQLNKLNDSREKIGTTMATFSEHLASLKQPQNTTDSELDTEHSTAQELIYNIDRLLANQKLIELEWEQRSFDVRRDILRNERQLAERNVLTFEKNASIVQQALNIARSKAATDSVSTAETTSKKFGQAHPALEKELNINQSLATESAEISANITALSKRKQTIEVELEHYRQSFNSMQDKIDSAGLSDTIGIRLRNAKNLLPDLSSISKSLKNQRNEVEKVQLRRIELEDRSMELVDINKEVDDRLSAATFKDETERELVAQQLEQVLSDQKNNFLPNVLASYDNYFEKTLIPLIDKEKEYIKLIDDYTIYINERILWIKSSKVFSHHDLIQSIKSLTWLINPGKWNIVLNDMLIIAKNNLFVTVMLCLLFITTFFSRSYLLNKLRHYGRYKTKLSLAEFSDSIKSGILTLVIAAYWPFLFWIIALGIINSQSVNTFTLAVAQGLLATASVLFFIVLFLQMVRNSGLAESHFRWKIDNIILIKHQLLWFGPLVIPFVFILQTTNNQPIQSHFDSLGRLAFICITGLTAILLYKLINPQKGLFKEEIHQHKDGWLSRTRFIWLPIILCLPLALAITAIAGYLYTATELMMLLINSFWIILAAIIVRGFLFRWFSITQRKIAMEQIRKKMASQTEAEESAESSHAAEAGPAPGGNEVELDLDQVSKQTLKLLNNFTGLAIIIGLYLNWADILPALNMLDNITLWESSSTSPDGQLSTTTITLTNGLTALAILLVTTLVGINIPGLLEIAVLQKLPFTPSARYGITTIARYVIIIIGTILTFNAIGIGWSKVQWLAAAVTVGLGFGLQEIFANFVSGIIILIERQIRVGDAVTVGNISGRVSRIKMRATTIVDWDKKELIIPNKEFVTGQVINWTLTDTVIRLVIPIGVAYGSKTEKVLQILLKLAKQNEYVMEDPEPEALFAGFGESTLDFELRVFLPNSDLRISTRHDLLMQIDQAFRKENIEIAFPQRDIHIRSIAEPLNLPQKGTKD